VSINSTIEWTDATWNPIRGCTKISPGCKHCYASTFAERFRGVPGHPFEQGFDLLVVPEKLDDPLHWKKSRRIFVNSMSDFFHESVSDEYIIRVANVMMEANWHTYQVLTKRSERMRDLLNSTLASAAKAPHIWWGVSVEDQKYGVPRIAHLQAAKVAVRFVSAEPLLEDLGSVNLTGIDWLIVGGESGHGARPFHLDWARNLIRECKRQHVACFVKQVGRQPWDGGQRLKLASAKGGDMAEWPVGIRVREYPVEADALLAGPAETSQAA
jgi:protein gp37